MLFLAFLNSNCIKIAILHYLHYANFDHFKMSLNKHEINQDEMKFNIPHIKFKFISQPHQNSNENSNSNFFWLMQDSLSTIDALALDTHSKKFFMNMDSKNGFEW